ncbi:MAG: bifunctional oligoribonuclease/PAP phosphatase NrnA [Bacteroidales bacterium]|jgi:bifunctional oligoribonuclease and PAP phosphatase NrnA|nr:bifunctional oligoribonuclease/PAP phosphatase NrnA [Bacteroidales bacterium]
MLSKIIDQRSIDVVQKRIDEARRIVIVTHISPDGDAIGSSLALYHYLKGLGKKVSVVTPNSMPDFLLWLPGANDVSVHSEKKEESETIVSQAELIFALDFNVLKRLEGLSSAVEASKTHKILVDHHPHPGDCWSLVISHPEICSTSELIFRLICRMGDFNRIDKPIAECIYTGMMTDTGSFTYNSNSPEIYFIISELLTKGIDKDAIYAKVFSNFSADRFRLMGFLLSQRMKIYDRYPVALLTLTLHECENYNYQKGDAEGFVNMPLSISGVIFSIFMREDQDKIKISLRSTGSFPCNKIASECFGGGGHLNASGGEFYGTMEAAIQLFESALPNYLPYFEAEKVK